MLVLNNIFQISGVKITYIVTHANMILFLLLRQIRVRFLKTRTPFGGVQTSF